MTSSHYKALALLSVLALASACGSSVTDDSPGSGGSGSGGNGAGGSGDGGSGGGGESCELVPPGQTFSFVITNVGTRDLGVNYGCGGTVPIDLTLPEGDLGLGPGNADFCEVSCDQVYAGASNWGCSDCGPGSGGAIAPGQTLTITWDRRAYRKHTAPAACSGHPDQNECALGVAVPTSVNSGTLNICSDYSSFPGACSADESFPFALDLSLDSVAIDIQ